MPNPYEASGSAEYGANFGRALAWRRVGFAFSTLLASICIAASAFTGYSTVALYSDFPDLRALFIAVTFVFLSGASLFIYSAACYRARKARRGLASFVGAIAYVVIAELLAERLI